MKPRIYRKLRSLFFAISATLLVDASIAQSESSLAEELKEISVVLDVRDHKETRTVSEIRSLFIQAILEIEDSEEEIERNRSVDLDLGFKKFSLDLSVKQDFEKFIDYYREIRKNTYQYLSDDFDQYVLSVTVPKEAFATYREVAIELIRMHAAKFDTERRGFFARHIPISEVEDGVASAALVRIEWNNPYPNFINQVPKIDAIETKPNSRTGKVLTKKYKNAEVVNSFDLAIDRSLSINSKTEIRKFRVTQKKLVATSKDPNKQISAVSKKLQEAKTHFANHKVEINRIDNELDRARKALHEVESNYNPGTVLVEGPSEDDVDRARRKVEAFIKIALKLDAEKGALENRVHALNGQLKEWKTIRENGGKPEWVGFEIEGRFLIPEDGRVYKPQPMSGVRVMTSPRTIIIVRSNFGDSTSAVIPAFWNTYSLHYLTDEHFRRELSERLSQDGEIKSIERITDQTGATINSITPMRDGTRAYRIFRHYVTPSF